MNLPLLALTFLVREAYLVLPNENICAILTGNNQASSWAKDSITRLFKVPRQNKYLALYL